MKTEAPAPPALAAADTGGCSRVCGHFAWYHCSRWQTHSCELTCDLLVPWDLLDRLVTRIRKSDAAGAWTVTSFKQTMEIRQ